MNTSNIHFCLGKERAAISWQKIVWWFEDLAKYLNDNYAEGIDILKDPSRVFFCHIDEPFYYYIFISF
jgi:hypothetical protein